MKPLVYSPEARAELEEAAFHYEERREGLGTDFQAEIEAAEARIRRNPLLYPVYNDEGFRKCLVHRFPYTIYYLELEDRIWIAAIAHQKRRPGYWRGRDPE